MLHLTRRFSRPFPKDTSVSELEKGSRTDVGTSSRGGGAVEGESRYEIFIQVDVLASSLFRLPLRWLSAVPFLGPSGPTNILLLPPFPFHTRRASRSRSCSLHAPLARHIPLAQNGRRRPARLRHRRRRRRQGRLCQVAPRARPRLQQDEEDLVRKCVVLARHPLVFPPVASPLARTERPPG